MSKFLSFIRPKYKGPSIFPDDVFIVGYPKSGNTWLNFLIASLVAERIDDVDFKSINTYVPDIYNVSNADLLKFSRPRVMKSHDAFTSTYPKVLYVVRDPRDVAVSYYHHAIRLKIVSEGYPIQDFVERFVRGEFDSYGTWGSHVSGWTGAQHNQGQFHFVTYEKLKENGIEAISEVALHLGLSPSADKIEKVMKHCGFSNMQSMDKQRTVERARPGHLHIRSGKSGKWRETLPKESIELIHSAWAKEMKMVGYECE